MSELSHNRLPVFAPSFTRREILKSFGALGALSCLGGCRSFCSTVSGLVDDVRAVARFGVLANLELSYGSGKASDALAFRRALTYFIAHDVEAVVIIGPRTKSSRPSDLKFYEDTWVDVIGRRQIERIEVPDEGRVFTVKGVPFYASFGKPATAVFRQEPAPRAAFYGQGKLALTDEMGFFPHSSLRLSAGSMSGCSARAGVQGGGAAASSAEGLLVTAYSNSVRVSRLDFMHDSPAVRGRAYSRPYAEKVADDWVVPSGEPDRTLMPRFPKDARLVCIRGYSGGSIIYTLKWAAALTCYGGARAFYYEVTVVTEEAPTVPFLCHYMQSNGYYLSEERDDAPLQYVLYRRDVEVAGTKRIRIGVTPVSSFGTHGETLWTDYFQLG